MTEKEIKESYLERAGLEDGDLVYDQIKDKYEENILALGVGTYDGFDYDILSGGYVDPLKILKDKERAKKLVEAVELINQFGQELIDDGIYNEY